MQKRWTFIFHLKPLFGLVDEEEYGWFQTETECKCVAVPKLTEAITFKCVKMANWFIRAGITVGRLALGILTISTSEKALDCSDGNNSYAQYF